LESVEPSLSNDKPCLAVWGPSQSGKSTLLSFGLDAHADPQGRGSALHWDGGRPCRLSKDDKVPADATVLNPFNQKSDASGCVTRFVLRNESEIPDVLRPVEIHFARRPQILLAL